MDKLGQQTLNLFEKLKLSLKNKEFVSQHGYRLVLNDENGNDTIQFINTDPSKKTHDHFYQSIDELICQIDGLTSANLESFRYIFKSIMDNEIEAPTRVRMVIGEGINLNKHLQKRCPEVINFQDWLEAF